MHSYIIINWSFVKFSILQCNNVCNIEYAINGFSLYIKKCSDNKRDNG